MIRACLHENSFQMKMSIKLILKLSHCNFQAITLELHCSVFSLFPFIRAWLLNFKIITLLPLDFLLFCRHWISLCWLGCKQYNVYYVTSSTDVKLLCDLKQCFLIGFLWSCPVIYNILSHDIPSHIWHMETYIHMLHKFLFFSSRSKWTKTVWCLFLSHW